MSEPPLEPCIPCRLHPTYTEQGFLADVYLQNFPEFLPCLCTFPVKARSGSSLKGFLFLLKKDFYNSLAIPSKCPPLISENLVLGLLC